MGRRRFIKVTGTTLVLDRSSFSRTNGRLCGCPTVGKLRRIDAQFQLLHNFLSKTLEVDVAKWTLKIHCLVRYQARGGLD
jgi:hypothetical protein